LAPFLTVSVIIPTYNRLGPLARTLSSLRQQTLPPDQFEVIVVDDGSAADVETVIGQPYPFAVRCLRQSHLGATAARNLGAMHSQAEVLVFIDDDVTIAPPTLAALAATCGHKDKALVMGTIHMRSGREATVYASVVLTMVRSTIEARDGLEFHFLDCNSELLACRRIDLLELGLFQDPTEGHGWPNWDDVDLGYRAYVNRYRLLGTSQAVAEHWDETIADRAVACQRYFRAGRSAVWLFLRHPELRAQIPMLRDKTPIAWGQDPLPLILRKLARLVVSSRLGLAAMAATANFLERYYPRPGALRRIYHWLHGAHLLHGYRNGLKEYARAAAETGAWRTPLTPPPASLP
jgi:glycosyltransferase involved in cell wall biosynthesis